LAALFKFKSPFLLLSTFCLLPTGSWLLAPVFKLWPTNR